MCVCVCLYIHIYNTYIHTYIHIYTHFHLVCCSIVTFIILSQCIFSHALHDQVFNLPHRFFSSLSFVVNNILIEHKAT